MSTHLKTRQLVAIALCLLAIPALVTAQDFLISKGRDDLNLMPRAALNTTTGDVFVVWRGAIVGDSVNFEIYSSLVDISSNGKGKAKKVRKVGSNNHRFYFFDVAYDPVGNCYLVIWNGSYENETQDSLFGQFFKANGRPMGSEFKILSDSQFSPLFPVICSVPTSGNAPAADEARFIIAYSWNNGKIGDTTDNGLISQLLDGNAEPVGGEHEIFDSVLNNVNRPSTFINERLMPLSDGTYFLTTGHETNDSIVIDEPMIFKLRANGTRQASRTLDTDNNRYTSAVEISKKRLLTFWRNGRTYTYQQINPKTFSPRRRTDASDEIIFAANSELVKLGDDPGALHLIFSGTSIRVYYVNKKAKAMYPEIDDIEFGYNVDFYVFAMPLPDSNRVLILVSKNDTEIRGLIYEQDLP